MGPGNLNHGAPVGSAHIQHINPQQLALHIAFAGDLLVLSQQRVGHFVALAHTDDHIAGTGYNPGNGAGEQLLGLAGVALVHHAPLCLPDALDHHLLGGLGGNAAELLIVHGDMDLVPHLGVFLIVPGSVDLDFQSGILHLFHGGLHQVNAEAVLVQIYHHVVGGNIPVILPVLPVGVGQGLLQPLHHIVNGNALQLFQLPQACENLRAHIDLGLLLCGFCFSCHVSSSNQNSTRSRTNATWDFSNVTVSFPTSRVTLPSS